MNRDIVSEPIEFEWDKGNIDKNFKKHGVKNEDAESIFFDKKSLLIEDLKHSKIEHRYQILGESGLRVRLSIFFTLRNNRVRIISARKMNDKERNLYENKKNKRQK